MLIRRYNRTPANVGTIDTGTMTAKVGSHLGGDAYWSCAMVYHSLSSSENFSLVNAGTAEASGFHVPSEIKTGYANLTATGEIHGDPPNTIQMICNTRNASVTAVEADLTAVSVDKVNGAAVKGRPAHRPIMNLFKPRLRHPAARPTRSQAHH